MISTAVFFPLIDSCISLLGWAYFQGVGSGTAKRFA